MNIILINKKGAFLTPSFNTYSGYLLNCDLINRRIIPFGNSGCPYSDPCINILSCRKGGVERDAVIQRDAQVCYGTSGKGLALGIVCMINYGSCTQIECYILDVKGSCLGNRA